MIPNQISLSDYGLKEATVRLCLKEGSTLYGTKPISSAEDGVDVIYDLLSTLDREVVCVVNMDTRNRPLNYSIVSMGAIDSSIVPIRSVFTTAILSNAAKFMLFHNHPSGDPSPSTADFNVTARVLEASKLMGIPMVDHVIIGGDRNAVYSFQAANPDMFADDDYDPEKLWGEAAENESVNDRESENVSESDTTEELSFSEQVDLSLKNMFDRYSDLKVCETPELLQQLGLRSLPMFYTQKHLRDAIHSERGSAFGVHFHGLTVAQIKRMPDWLASPMIVYDSLSRSDAVIVVTGELDEKKRPIIIAITPDGTAKYKAETVESNFVLSMYGHEHFNEQIEKALAGENILYVSKKMSQDLLGVLMLPLLQGLRDLGSNEIIHQSRNISSHQVTENKKEKAADNESENENVSASDTTEELSFSEQVDLSLNGELDFYSAIKVKNSTPEILQAAGLRPLPMLYTQSHLRNAVRPANNSHNHGIAVDVIKQVPEYISEPIAIYDSLSRSDSVVEVLDLFDENDNPIVVSIFPDGQGRYRLENIETNFITSIYYKSRFGSSLERAINDDKLLYLNKEKTQAMYERWGLQLPELTSSLALNCIIHQSSNISSHQATENKKEEAADNESENENVSASDTNEEKNMATGSTSKDGVVEENMVQYGAYANRHLQRKGDTMEITLKDQTLPLTPGPALASRISYLEMIGYGHPQLNDHGTITVDHMGARNDEVVCLSSMPYTLALNDMLKAENVTTGTLAFFLNIDESVVQDVLAGKTWLSHDELVQIANLLGYSARGLEGGVMEKGTDYSREVIGMDILKMAEERYIVEAFPVRNIMGYEPADSSVTDVYLIYDSETDEYLYSEEGTLNVYTDIRTAMDAASAMNNNDLRNQQTVQQELSVNSEQKNVSESDTSIQESNTNKNDAPAM